MPNTTLPRNVKRLSVTTFPMSARLELMASRCWDRVRYLQPKSHSFWSHHWLKSPIAGNRSLVWTLAGTTPLLRPVLLTILRMMWSTWFQHTGRQNRLLSFMLLPSRNGANGFPLHGQKMDYRLTRALAFNSQESTGMRAFTCSQTSLNSRINAVLDSKLD